MGQARAPTRSSICGGISNEPIAHFFLFFFGSIYMGQARAQTRGSVCGGGLTSLLRGG